MSQVTDYTIDNSTGANVRADINAVLGAIATNNSGSSAQGIQALGFFANTSDTKLQLRNAADNAFVNLRGFDGSCPLPDGSSSSPSLFFDDDTNTGLFSSAADTLNFTTGGVERLELGATTIFNEDGADVDFRIEGDTEANLFYVDAGNDRIGIGTSSPSGKLDIVTGSSGGNVLIDAESSSAFHAKVVNDSGDLTLGARNTNADTKLTSQRHIHFQTGSSETERMRIDSSGRLLKGFTASAPAFGVDSAMQIVGNSFADSSLMLRRDADSANPAGLVFAKSRSSSKGGTTVVQNGDQLGTIVFTAADGSDLVSDGAQIRAKVDGTAGSNDVPTRLEFLTAPDGGSSVSERMRIDKDGNVSIGVSGTTNRFHVEGTTTGSRFGVDVSSSGVACIAATNESNADVELVIFDGRSSIGSSVNIPIAFHTNGKTNEVMRMTNDGKLLVGHTNNQGVAGGSSKIQVQSNDSTGRISIVQHRNEASGAPFLSLGKTRATSTNNNTLVQNGDTLGTVAWAGGDGTDIHSVAVQIVAQVDDTPAANDMPGRLLFFTTPDGSDTPAERMRLDSAGNLCLGETGEPAAGTDGIRFEATGATKLSTTGTGERNIFEFKNANGNVGKIVTQNSNTSYGTSSDYRLKENVVAISDGITRLKQLKPSRFNFIVKKDLTQDGFLAHEVQSVVPEAISGEKDAVKEDGSIDPQAIDLGRLVPLLVAAVQELITKVETLEAA